MYNTSQAGPHRALAPPKLTPSTPLKHPSSNTQPQATCQTAQALDTCGPQQSLGDAPASSMPSGSMARQGLETSAGGSAGRTQAGMGTTQTGTTQTGTTQAGETQVGRSQASRTHEGRTHSVQPVSATAGASDESADPVEMGSVVLPRMPLGLSHITTDTAYTAVAGVARALGKCSMAAAPHPSTRSGWLWIL